MYTWVLDAKASVAKGGQYKTKDKKKQEKYGVRKERSTPMTHYPFKTLESNLNRNEPKLDIWTKVFQP